MLARLVLERQVAIRVVEERREDHPVAAVSAKLINNQVDWVGVSPLGLRGDRLFTRGLIVDVAIVDGPPAIGFIEDDLAK